MTELYWAFPPLVASASHHIWGVQSNWVWITRNWQRKTEKKEKRKGRAGKNRTERSSDCSWVWLWAVGRWREELHTHLEQLVQLHLKRRVPPQSLCRHFLIPPFSFSLFFFLTCFLWWSVNRFVSSYWLPERWGDFPLCIRKEECVIRREREEET